MSLESERELKSITIKYDDGKTEKIPTDIILGFFGLIMKLGPIILRKIRNHSVPFKSSKISRTSFLMLK